MATSPKDTLKDLVLGNTVERSDNNLADSLRTSCKIVVLTQAAYDALTPKDSNTIYITVD